MPELPEEGLPGGTVTHEQINFPLHVVGDAGWASRTPVTGPGPAR